MASTNWFLDTDHWPGPDRRRWRIVRDLVEPSPDGQLACILYSCCEIRLGCEVGLLTLLGGSPESPTVLVQPRDFTCLDCSPSPSAQWLRGSRFVVVTAYLYNARRNRVDLQAFTFLDTSDRTVAFFDISLEVAGRRFVEDGHEWVIPARSGTSDSAEIRIFPGDLTWKQWDTFRS